MALRERAAEPQGFPLLSDPFEEENEETSCRDRSDTNVVLPSGFCARRICLPPGIGYEVQKQQVPMQKQFEPIRSTAPPPGISVERWHKGEELRGLLCSLEAKLSGNAEVTQVGQAYHRLSEWGRLHRYDVDMNSVLDDLEIGDRFPKQRRKALEEGYARFRIIALRAHGPAVQQALPSASAAATKAAEMSIGSNSSALPSSIQSGTQASSKQDQLMKRGVCITPGDILNGLYYASIGLLLGVEVPDEHAPPRSLRKEKQISARAMNSFRRRQPQGPESAHPQFPAPKVGNSSERTSIVSGENVWQPTPYLQPHRSFTFDVPGSEASSGTEAKPAGTVAEGTSLQEGPSQSKLEEPPEEGGLEFVKRLEKTSLSKVQEALSAMAWPIDRVLEKQFKAKNLSSTPWEESQGLPKRSTTFMMPPPSDIPSVVTMLVSLPELAKVTVMSELRSTEKEVALDTEVHMKEYPYCDDYFVKADYVFRSLSETSTAMYTKMEVIWLNELPWTHAAIKMFIESGAQANTRDQAANLARFLETGAVPKEES